MAKFKDSGIPWIGMIPKDWEVKRLKEVFVECKEKSLDGAGELLSLSQYKGVQLKKDTDKAGTHESETNEGYNVVHKGQLVMNIMLAWNGSYAISDYDGIISPAYCVFDFRTDCVKRYFHYLLRTNGYPSAFKTLSRGIIDSRLRLYPEQFYTFPTILPPLPTQQRIADFLDRKCAEIVELAALQETMIEELKRYKQSLITETVTGKWKIENGKGKTGKWKVENGKLKDSGVEWIGEIPEGWEVRKIKTMATLKSGNNLTTNDFLEGEDGYPVYGGNGFRGYYSQYSNDGDFVLIGRQGALCGNINYAHGKFWATDHAVVCYPKCEFFLTWFGESLRAMNLNQYSLSSAQPGLSVDRIRELYMVVPPLSEQQQIADFLDRKCAEIDELIAVKQQKIEALKEYKKSVIFEYVTGKKEVME